MMYHRLVPFGESHPVSVLTVLHKPEFMSPLTAAVSRSISSGATVAGAFVDGPILTSNE